MLKCALSIKDDNRLAGRIHELWDCQPAVIVPLALELCRNRRPPVRLLGAAVLAGFSRFRRADVCTVLHRLTKDRSSRVRAQAYLSLAEHGGWSAVRLITEGLNSASAAVRLAAIRSIAPSIARRFSASIRRLARDPSPGVREWSIFLVARLGDRIRRHADVDLLWRAARDTCAGVRREAMTGLIRAGEWHVLPEVLRELARCGVRRRDFDRLATCVMQFVLGKPRLCGVVEVVEELLATFRESMIGDSRTGGRSSKYRGRRTPEMTKAVSTERST